MKRTLAALLIAASFPAFAISSFSASRPSSFHSTPSYRPAPAPAPRVIQNVTVNRTTVVHQAPASSGSSGGGMMSGIVGSVIGTGIGHWLFAPKAPAPTPAQVVDCARQPLPVEWVQYCQKPAQ